MRKPTTDTPLIYKVGLSNFRRILADIWEQMHISRSVSSKVRATYRPLRVLLQI